MKKLAVFILVLGTAWVFADAITQKTQEASSWDLLRKLVLIPGVSGHEEKVSDFIQSDLPASVKPQRDAKANVWFTVGDGRPHILFVAHSDELGYIVEKITPQGTAILRSRGGLLAQASEARPFVIHTAKGPVEGIIQPNPDYFKSRAVPPAQAPAQTPPQSQPQPAPGALEVYLGVSTEHEARALGVTEGNPVIVKKKIVDLAPDIMATRAVDDRAGCAALLAAALEIDWSTVRTKTVTFAWDVEEEIGLMGAQALAKILKPDYVFAVDTFVSTDSPLENKRFGNAVLGKGAVLRSIDTSNITPKTEIRRVIELAAKHKIPIQVRNSRGGNDGSVFVADGAVDIPLSWPGAYAHSFIEKIVRSDLEALTNLIIALVEEWR